MTARLRRRGPAEAGHYVPTYRAQRARRRLPTTRPEYRYWACAFRAVSSASLRTIITPI